MSRTMWLAVFCLAGLGPAIAIKVAAPPASSIVETAPDQGKAAPAFALNELAKSDRLELSNARAEPGIIAPAAKPTSVETPSANPETVEKAADRHWRNANASIIVPAAPPRRHAKSKELKPSAVKFSPSEKPEVWHCRQDAVGSLLRSLDLSPRCDL